jgi:hypothetical protein
MPITNERHEALQAAWESCRDRWPIGYDEFAQAMQGWSVEPVRVDGRIVGAVLMRGAEVHACIRPEGFGRWLSRRVLRSTLARVVAEHGRAETTVTTGNEAGEAFVRRLGFVESGRSNGVTRYTYGH